MFELWERERTREDEKRERTLYWVSLQLSIQEANLRAEAEAEANFGSSDFWAEEVD